MIFGEPELVPPATGGRLDPPPGGDGEATTIDVPVEGALDPVDATFVAYVWFDADGAIKSAGTSSVGGLRAVQTIVGGDYLVIPPSWIGAGQQGDLKNVVEQAFVSLGGAMPVLTAKDGCPASVSGTTFTNLPVPCRVEVTDSAGQVETYPWSSSSMVFDPDHADTYRIRVLSVPYLPGVFTVTAS